MCNRASGFATGFFILILTALVVAPVWSQEIYASEIELEGEETGIKVVGETPLFDYGNMLPGDSDEASLTIKNEGRYEFEFDISSKLLEGEKAFYEVLEIEVSGEEEIYYQGSLDELSGVDITALSPGSEKELNLEVHFPTGPGNILQGMGADVDFVFNAWSTGDKESGEKTILEEEESEAEASLDVPPETPEVPPEIPEEIPEPPEMKPGQGEVIPEAPGVDPEIPEIAYPEIGEEQAGDTGYINWLLIPAALMVAVMAYLVIRRKYRQGATKD